MHFLDVEVAIRYWPLLKRNGRTSHGCGKIANELGREIQNDLLSESSLSQDTPPFPDSSALFIWHFSWQESYATTFPILRSRTTRFSRPAVAQGTSR